MYLKKVYIMDENDSLSEYNNRGVCRISQGVGPTLKFLEFLIYMPRSGMSRAAKLRAFGRGVWGHAPPQENFKNGAISCVLRAIFNHFHGKKSSEKIINKHEFFH